MVFKKNIHFINISPESYISLSINGNYLEWIKSSNPEIDNLT